MLNAREAQRKGDKARLAALRQAALRAEHPLAQWVDYWELGLRLGQASVDEVEAKMAEAKAGKLALAVIDNNPRTVFEQGHLPGARWIKHTEVRAEDLPSNRDTMLVFYCSSGLGMACHTGAVSAVKLGYKNVFIMPAGLKGWKKAGKPLET